MTIKILTMTQKEAKTYKLQEWNKNMTKHDKTKMRKSQEYNMAKTR